jgi:GT2 family glycosyltransferase
MTDPAKSILAVLVLYKTEPQASPAFTALAEALLSRPGFAESVSLLVADNSREPHLLPPAIPAEYLHDGSNPGLARRYNYALDAAVEQRCPWLLLVDQDTRLTATYLDELLELSQNLLGQTEVVAIVPRLTVGEAIQSPHAPSHRRPARFDPNATGLATGLVRAYNSGALLRVSALMAAGGFPLSYPLDYLDHATLHRLQLAGGRVFVMNARLDHEMSIYRPERHADPAHAGRHRGQLAAEIRFYREHGSLAERLRHRIDLLRQAAHSARGRRWPEMLRLLRAVISRAGTYA